MEDFKFATFNIHHGKDKATIYSHKEMLESVSSIDADILCIQELDAFSLRTYFADQPKLIAKKFDYHYVTCKVRFFGLGYQYNAIFSRKPILSSQEIILPQHGNQQLRKALTAEIGIGPQKIQVATTHLHTHHGKTRFNDWAQKQLMFLLDKHKAHDVCLIGGDLNLLPSEVIPIAQDYDYVAPNEYYTSPGISPKRQIDWILGRNIYLADIHTSDLLSSDHRALIATATEVPF